jgi:hypothetical protein
MPILLPDLPATVVDALVQHIGDPKAYAAPYPVPSTALNDPLYLKPSDGRPEHRLEAPLARTVVDQHQLVHRPRPAPPWSVELARTIEDRSAALIEQHGFREYYDPYTGEGFGAHAFSWTALVLNMLADHEGVA